MEMTCLVTPKEILNFIGFGSEDRVAGSGGIYHILYRTKLIRDNRIYIGVMNSKDPDSYKSRNYIGCGISKGLYTSNIPSSGKRFHRAVSKYGVSAFVREDLLYFDSEASVLSAEALIVTEAFVANKMSLNSIVGGGKPPTGIGVKNNNYGNRWSEEQKERARISRSVVNKVKYERDNNGKAIDCYLVDLVDMSVKKFGCLRSLTDFTGVAYSVVKHIDKEVIVAKRYLAFRSLPADIHAAADRALRNSKFSNNIIRLRNHENYKNS